MRTLLAWLILVLAPLAAASDGARVALVIGNAKYRDSPLINPVNDARSLSAALRSAGPRRGERVIGARASASVPGIPRGIPDARSRGEQSGPWAPQAPSPTDTDHHFAPLPHSTAPPACQQRLFKIFFAGSGWQSLTWDRRLAGDCGR